MAVTIASPPPSSVGGRLAPVSGSRAGVGSSVGVGSTEVGFFFGCGFSVGVAVGGEVGVGRTLVGVGDGGFDGVRVGTVCRRPL